MRERVRQRLRRWLQVGATHDEVRERLDRQHHRIAEVERELQRLSPQVSALEERLEDLRERRATSGATAGSPEEAEVRTLWEDVRRQHEQVRARLAVATRFEERLRRLEEGHPAEEERPAEEECPAEEE